MKILYVDVETTGLNWNADQVLEIGMVMDDLDAQLPLEQLPRLRLVLQHEVIAGNAYALHLNRELLREIAENKSPDLVHPKVAYMRVVDWLSKHHSDKVRINACGKNAAGFDFNFLERVWGFERLGSQLKVGGFVIRQRVLDPGSLWWNPLRDDALPDTNACAERAGISRQTDHTAIGDCLLCAEMVRAWVAAFVE